jgi:hypothetical protein
LQSVAAIEHCCQDETARTGAKKHGYKYNDEKDGGILYLKRGKLKTSRSEEDEYGSPGDAVRHTKVTHEWASLNEGFDVHGFP